MRPRPRGLGALHGKKKGKQSPGERGTPVGTRGNNRGFGDDDNNSGYTVMHGAPESQFQPSAPYMQRKKSSPRGQLRGEIIEVKREIAQKTHEITEIDAEICTLKIENSKFRERAASEPDFWKRSDDTVRSIQTLTEQRLENSRQITQAKDRLAWLEIRLAKAEDEAATASIKNAIRSSLSTEGPDVANIIDNRKFETMKAWLDEENALLLRSPPGSGKTTFALSFAAYLDSKKFKVTYLNASLAQSSVSDTRSMDNVWQDAFESDSTFSDMCTTSSEDNYIIIDEAQSWYPLNAKDRGAQQQLNRFWADVKFFVKPALKLANYVKRSYASSTPTSCVRVLCLAGYGEANVGSIATPLVFVDPVNVATNIRLPLGLQFLRLDRDMTNALIARFVEIKESEGKKMTFDPDVHELIYQETNGHVGAIRTLLFYFVSTDKRSKQDVINFTQREIYRSDLSAYRAFLSVSEATIRQLPSEDLATLVECIVLYKKGHREFSMKELRVAELVKLGIFIKTNATAIGGQTTVAFPSPLHFDIALYNVLHRTVELRQTHQCFEQVLRELVLRMSPKVLQETTPHGNVPYECQWHQECHRSFISMSRTHLKASVGREFNTRAFLDMYINAELQWGIELIREGDGRRLKEHFERFQPGGRYRPIAMREYALINFTSRILDQSVLDEYDDHVWHLVYNDMYTKVTVYRKGNFTEDWDLIGHQGRTEY